MNKNKVVFGEMGDYYWEADTNIYIGYKPRIQYKEDGRLNFSSNIPESVFEENQKSHESGGNQFDNLRKLLDEIFKYDLEKNKKFGDSNSDKDVL